MRFAASLLPFVLLAVACGAPEAEQPPVILVTVDGLTADELAVFGGPLPAPALAELAAAGSAWADAWTAAPMTRPAAATYLTGLAPDRHGVRDDLFTPLADDVPTLAGLLAEQGYQTAALADSSFLGQGSGLLRGFGLADDPPSVPPTPGRWLPSARETGKTVSNVVSWIASLPEGEPYFAWVHLSSPIIGRFQEALGPKLIGGSMKRAAEAQSDGVADDEEPPDYSDGVESLDAAVAGIVGALADRGDLERALIIVASTQGDISGGETDPIGSGFSLHERAIRVPVIARFPAGAAEPRPATSPVWSPDVAQTIAELTGVALSDRAEGISLLAEAPEDRVLLSWSWAPLDQMGWKPLRAARVGQVKRTEGDGATTERLDGGHEVAQADEQRLARALSERLDPRAATVALSEVEPLLVGRGLTLAPVAADGRSDVTPEVRRAVTNLVWRGRFVVRVGRPKAAGGFFLDAQKQDPENLAAHLDLGHLMSMSGRPKAVEAAGRAAELYPDNPEVLHWLAHAIWLHSWQEAEPFLLAIRAFKEQDPDVLYDLACARSLDGDLAASEEFLRASIAAGFRQWNLIESDPDLRNLRQSGRLSAVVSDYR